MSCEREQKRGWVDGTYSMWGWFDTQLTLGDIDIVLFDHVCWVFCILAVQ